MLKELSDVRDNPTALIPYWATKLLLREADREGCPAALGADLRKHLDRLQQKWFMFFWKGVMSFSPMYVLMVREHVRTDGSKRPVRSLELTRPTISSKAGHQCL